MCFAVNPLEAVYTYTPSKLPSSVAADVKPEPTPGVNNNNSNEKTVAKPVLSLSPLAADAGVSGCGSLESLELAECSGGEMSSVSSVEAIETLVVYSSVVQNQHAVSLKITPNNKHFICSIFDIK